MRFGVTPKHINMIVIVKRIKVQLNEKDNGLYPEWSDFLGYFTGVNQCLFRMVSRSIKPIIINNCIITYFLGCID